MSKPEDRHETTRNWAKYTGIAGQLLGTIGICVFLGIWLDGHFATTPLLTVVLSLVGVIGGLYVAIKDFL